MSIQIAIDGPSGAGKSTMAKMLAKQKQFIYLDTGAMYRSFGLFAIENGVDFTQWNPEKDQEKIESMIESFTLEIRYIEESQHVIVNGVDFTRKIRTPEVSLAASKVAVIPAVRLKLVEIQREIAAENNVVMDGRDIGSYVLPNATVKIFLTASAEERAKRRHLELQEKGDSSTYEEVLADMKFRDENDSKRAFAPLTCAEDAVRLDTTKLNLEESVEAMKKIIEERL